jgi:hypothetical protein
MPRGSISGTPALAAGFTNNHCLISTGDFLRLTPPLLVAYAAPEHESKKLVTNFG